MDLGLHLSDLFGFGLYQWFGFSGHPIHPILNYGPDRLPHSLVMATLETQRQGLPLRAARVCPRGALRTEPLIVTHRKMASDHPNQIEDTNEARALNTQPKNRTNTRAGRVVAGEMLLWLCAFTVVVTSAIFAKERGSLPALAQVSTPTIVQPEAIPATEITEVGYEVEASPINEEAIARAIELTAEPAEIEPTDLNVRWFDGRMVRPVRTIYMTVTGYSPDARSCGKYADNKTAIMYSVWTNGMNLVAADPRVLPYKSLISVPGYAGSEIVPVMDCGGAIKGNRLDLLYPTHEMALQWGIRQLPVTVWEYVDETEQEG